MEQNMKLRRSLIDTTRAYDKVLLIVQTDTFVEDLYEDRDLINFTPIYQRGFVWTLDQKREYILGLFRGVAEITPTIVQERDENRKRRLEILDGKQRLSTIFDFIENKFSILVDEGEVFFDDLLQKDKRFLLRRGVRYKRVTSRNPMDSVPLQYKLMLFLEANALGTKATDEDLSVVKGMLKDCVSIV